MNWTTSWTTIGLALATLAGCGEEPQPPATPNGVPARHVAQQVDGYPVMAGAALGDRLERRPGDDLARTDVVQDKDTAVRRQLIYTAMLQLRVDDFTDVAQRVDSVVQQYGGFIASAEIHGQTGSPRSGTWTIRVPVKSYGYFLDAAAQLGDIEHRSVRTQEVTEEYYDLVARIANQQKQETRLLEHLATSTGKLDEILAVEQHIARVRGDIEQM